MKHYFGFMAMLASLLCPITAGDDHLIELITAPHRDEANIARNQFRNPAETLRFFGIKEDMHVIEITPGGGWYSEILAPYLREKGKYVAAGYDPQSEKSWVEGAIKKFQSKLAAHAEVYDKVGSAIFMGTNMKLGPANSADMVLTFRNVHNWMGAGTAAASFQKFFEVLKTGGVLGVVEHRGNPQVEQDPSANNGYVNQDYLIKLAENAGFILVGHSEINSNAKDSRDHTNGVWSLPPTLYKAGSQEKAMRAVGESDRATLKFVKP